MTWIRLIFGAVVLVPALVGVRPLATGPPRSSPTGASLPAPSGRSPTGAQGGGGRGNPAAALYTAACAPCHGIAVTAGPRAASLFDDEWMHGGDDESIAKNVREGFPAAGMQPFRDSLTEEQIWQLVVYLRTQATNLKGKPQYIADPDGRIVRSERQTFRMEVVARNLETPWALAFLPDGRLLITERPGRLRILEHGKLLPDVVKGVPLVWEEQDGGLLDIEVHPQYARNGWIYLSYSEPLPGSVPPPDPPSMTVIVRGKLNRGHEWVDQQVLFRAPAPVYNSSNAHYGSRFIFDRDNHLFFSIGDKMQMMDAQDLSKPTGKIHRVNDDGTVPKDNPFDRTPGAVPTVWSYGHRNPQGLAWDPVTGKLWESEHGPNGGDEINIVERAHNYGWGVITMGFQPGISKRLEPGMEPPIVYFTPSLAPSGMTFYGGDKYAGWKNNLFLSALAGQQLRRLEISGDKVTHQEAVFNQFGRVRDVIVGPDGILYVALQQPGEVLSQSTLGLVARLIPVRE